MLIAFKIGIFYPFVLVNKKKLGLSANLNSLESPCKISPPDSYFQAYNGPWNISSIPSWNIFILKNS